MPHGPPELGRRLRGLCFQHEFLAECDCRNVPRPYSPAGLPSLSLLLPLSPAEEGRQPWLCGGAFTLADVSLAVTLHRLKFLGFARRNWGSGKRPNLEAYYDRVLKRKTFNKVLGHVNNILISAVLPTAFRVARKRAPKVLGTTLAVGLLAGVGYFGFMLFRKRLGSMISALRPRANYF